MSDPMPVKSRVFVEIRRGERSESFSGTVTETRPGWVRILGPGVEPETVFHEWFSLNAKAVRITRFVCN